MPNIDTRFLTPEQIDAVRAARFTVDKLEQNKVKPLSLPEVKVNDTPPVLDFSPVINEFRKGNEQSAQVRQELNTIEQDTKKLEAQKQQIEEANRQRFGVNKLEDLLNTQVEALAQLDAESKQLQLEKQQLMDNLRQEASQQGRSVFEGGFTPEFRAREREIGFRQRTIAAKQLGTAAVVDALRGRLDLAINNVERATEIMFTPIQSEIEARLARLNFLKRELEINDSNRAKELSFRIREKELQYQNQLKQLEEQKREKKDIQLLAINALVNGADPLTVKAIQDARSLDEAIQVGGRFVVDPKKIAGDKSSTKMLGASELKTLAKMGLIVKPGDTMIDVYNRQPDKVLKSALFEDSTTDKGKPGFLKQFINSLFGKTPQKENVNEKPQSVTGEQGDNFVSRKQREQRLLDM